MKRSSRGYTLIEMMVVIGIVGIVVAVAVPLSSKVRERSHFNSAIREYQGKLALARSMAVGAETHPGWAAPNNRIRSAGIRQISPTQYTVFIDNDLAPGGEVDISVVDLVQARRSQISIVPAIPLIRMNNSGSLINSAVPVTIVFSDTQIPGRTKTLRLSLSGMSRIL